MDETWIYHYDPETKQQSVEWRYSGSPRPKKFRVQKSAGKVLASIFWDQDGILLIDYLHNSVHFQGFEARGLCIKRIVSCSSGIIGEWSIGMVWALRDAH
jgi:hypothetical protein